MMRLDRDQQKWRLRTNAATLGHTWCILGRGQSGNQGGVSCLLVLEAGQTPHEFTDAGRIDRMPPLRRRGWPGACPEC